MCGIVRRRVPIGMCIVGLNKLGQLRRRRQGWKQPGEKLLQAEQQRDDSVAQAVKDSDKEYEDAHASASQPRRYGARIAAASAAPVGGGEAAEGMVVSSAFLIAASQRPASNSFIDISTPRPCRCI